MAFRGLFIGIDRYISTGIDELTCARRDPMALEALFSDTLGGRTVLLADAEATRQRIEAVFGELAACDPEDTVVIAFSGHGSERISLSHTTQTWPTSTAPRYRLTCCRSGFRRYPQN